MAQHEDLKAKAQKRREEALQRAVNIEIDSFLARALLTRDGRRFLWWLLQIGQVGQQPFSTNDRVTAFNCGELNVGNKVLARITAVAPEGYVQMQQENLNEHNARVLDDAKSDPYSDAGDDPNAGAYDTGADAGPDTIT
jgi:hypothetical protein